VRTLFFPSSDCNSLHFSQNETNEEFEINFNITGQPEDCRVTYPIDSGWSFFKFYVYAKKVESINVRKELLKEGNESYQSRGSRFDSIF
jgi:hypothetical protein